MRSMVEGGSRRAGRQERARMWHAPSTVLRTVPLPVPGRN